MSEIEWYTEEISIGDREISNFYLRLKDGTVLNLSKRIKVGIIEIHEIFNEDLIFLSINEQTGNDYIAIYSLKQSKMIFPPIIEEFDTEDLSGYIYIQAGEDTMQTLALSNSNVNPFNDFAYLLKSGQIFQNEGIIEEQFGRYYILNQPSSRLYMVYSYLFDEDDCIGYRNIEEYYVDGEDLCLEEKNGVTVRLKLTGKIA